MEQVVLVLCLLGTVFTYPMYPQGAGTHGMASVSLETMRQQGPNKLTALPQLSGFGYNDPYSTLWLHGLLPPHMSYPWMHPRPQMPDNQQFEYALPIHPPPLPGVQSPKPTDPQNIPQQPPVNPAQADQLMYQPLSPMGFPGLQQVDPTLSTPQGSPADGHIQTVALFMYQTIMNKLLQQGAVDPAQDPSGVPPIHQQHPYPGLFFMQYGGGAGGPPARLGVMSSEEMQGGQAGAAHRFSALYPGLLGMGSGMGNLPQNPALQGDFTIEDDSPAAGARPAGQGASPGPNDNPLGVGQNPSVPGQEGNLAGQGEIMTFPNVNLPNMGFNPIGQSQLPQGVTPANDPRFPHDAGAGYVPYGVDETLAYSVQRETPINIDVTQTKTAIDTPIMQNDIHLQNHYFQEP
ncbi:ameloblastin [Bombina bombina]|uniref:ameloblastin n=1 Tax=Bombina bombina TaxID=8345 RepID=UPI00235AC2F5|nr:ameloblastin [Bombina bombina]